MNILNVIRLSNHRIIALSIIVKKVDYFTIIHITFCYKVDSQNYYYNRNLFSVEIFQR